MICKEGQFDIVETEFFKAFGINLNSQHVNGMTPFDLTVQSRKLVKMHVRFLDTYSRVYNIRYFS